MNHTAMRCLITTAPKHPALRDRLRTLFDTLTLERTAMEAVLREAKAANVPELALDDLTEGLADLVLRHERVGRVLREVAQAERMAVAP